MRKISLAYQTLDIHVYAGKRSKANKQKHLFLMENRRPLRYLKGTYLVVVHASPT
jgi:hypothetical protein